MTNITSEFNICLQKQGVQPILRKEYDLDSINTFLQEAYSINARIADLTRYLRSVRSSYLSAAQPSRRRHVNSKQPRPFSDSDRDRIDAESKQLLRELNNKISGIKQAEEIRNGTAEQVASHRRAKKGLGAIGRWARGDATVPVTPEEEREEAARKTRAAVNESIILFLQQRLEEAGSIQSEMMDKRLGREMEKAKSVLANTPQNRMFEEPSFRADDDDAASRSMQQELTAEQQQAFAEENHELVKHFEGQLDQLRTAEKSILEISELHSILHANLVQQSEHIEQLVQDSYLTTENLGKGNKELKRASERRSMAQMAFYSICAYCSILVVWDLIF